MRDQRQYTFRGSVYAAAAKLWALNGIQ